MDEYRAAQGGGFRCLLSEALPTVSSSTQIFANCPAGCAVVEISIRTQDMNLTFDASAASSANGNYYPKDNTYRLVLRQAEALKVRGIQLGVSATGYISYFGL